MADPRVVASLTELPGPSIHHHFRFPGQPDRKKKSSKEVGGTPTSKQKSIKNSSDKKASGPLPHLSSPNTNTVERLIGKNVTAKELNELGHERNVVNSWIVAKAQKIKERSDISKKGPLLPSTGVLAENVGPSNDSRKSEYLQSQSSAPLVEASKTRSPGSRKDSKKKLEEYEIEIKKKETVSLPRSSSRDMKLKQQTEKRETGTYPSDPSLSHPFCLSPVSTQLSIPFDQMFLHESKQDDQSGSEYDLSELTRAQKSPDERYVGSKSKKEDIQLPSSAKDPRGPSASKGSSSSLKESENRTRRRSSTTDKKEKARRKEEHDENLFVTLRRFDTVFLIDDSVSMSKNELWEETYEALSVIAEKAVKYDTGKFLLQKLEVRLQNGYGIDSVGLGSS